MRFAEPPDPAVHLYRGAPYVRTWSKHQVTVPGWSLCGVKLPTNATEDENAVTCEFCRSLMGTIREPYAPRAKKEPVP